MERIAIVVFLSVLLSLGLTSGAFSAQGGGHFGGGHSFGGGHFGDGHFLGGGHFHGGFGGFHHGSRVFIGGSFPFPYYFPYYSYYYPYYYPYAVSESPVYVEPAQPYYWYFCEDAQAYYPYVTSCPGGWTKVVPAPAQG